MTNKKSSNTTRKKTRFSGRRALFWLGNGILKLLKFLWRGLGWVRRKIYRFLMLFFYKKRYKVAQPHRRKHTLIIGSTGSGKSELMKSQLHHHILLGKTAIIWFDPNGDFAEQVAKFKENARPEREGKLTYINPAEFKDVFPVINPLDLPNVSTETLDKVTQALHKTMTQSFKEMDIQLTGRMEGMLYNMLHTLFRKKGSSLLELVRFVDDENNHDLIALGADTDNYVIKDYFENKFMNPTLSVTKVWLSDRVNNFLAAQSLQRLIVGKTTINLKREINQKNTIIFNLSKWKLGSTVAKIYGRFILTTILNLALARADIDENFRVPVHVYVDEFQNFLSDTFIEVFAEGRKYRVYLTVATQVVGLGMSSDVRKAILENANVKILGKAWYQSREEMMKQMGYTDSISLRKRGIWKRTFSKLMPGHFIFQYGISRPFKVKVPKFLLGDKHSMSDKKWQKIRWRLKETKYALPFYKQTPKNEVKTENISDFGFDNSSTILSEREQLLSKKTEQILPKRKFRSKFE